MGGGGRREGGGGGGYWQLSRGEGLRATHYYHMHTSRVCVCLGPWGQTDTHSLGFLSVADVVPSSRDGPDLRSGRVVAQLIDTCVGVGLNPSLIPLAPPLAAALKFGRAGLQLPPAHLVWAALPSDR